MMTNQAPTPQGWESTHTDGKVPTRMGMLSGQKEGEAQLSRLDPIVGFPVAADAESGQLTAQG